MKVSYARPTGINPKSEHRSTDDAEALLRVTAEIRATANHISDAVYLLDHEGIVRYANHALVKYNLQPEDVIGKHFLNFIAKEDRPELASAFERESEGAAEILEFHLIDCSKHHHFVRAYNQPIRIEGQFIGVEGVIVASKTSNQFEYMLERRAAQLALLNRIGTEISAALDVEQIQRVAVKFLHKSFGYYHVAMFVPDQSRGVLAMQARAGAFANLFPKKHAIQFGKGIVGWVHQNRQTVLANDVKIDPRYINLYPDRIPTRSELAVPILAGEKVIGILDIQSPLENAFDQNDIVLIETVANQLALAIVNAGLYQQVSLRLQEQERAEMLMRLQRDMLSGLSSTKDFEEALRVILDTLTRIQGIDCGSIYLVDETGGLDSVAHIGLTAAFAGAVLYLPPESHKSQFVREGRTAYMRYGDLNFDPRIPADVRSNENILSLAVLPIIHQSTVIADLTFGSHTLLEIPGEVRDVLEAVAAQLGATLARIKTEKALANSEARSAALLKAIPDLFFVVDSNGRFLSFKEDDHHSLYRLPKEFIHKTMAEILPPEVAGPGLDAVREALISHKTIELSYSLFSQSKQMDEFFEARISAIDDELAVIIIRNLTDQHLAKTKVEEREHMYSALFHQSRDALLLMDLQGLIVDSNTQAVDLFGYSYDELHGMDFRKLIHPLELEDAELGYQDLIAGNTRPIFERTIITKDGQSVRIEVSTSMVNDLAGNAMYIQSILRVKQEIKPSTPSNSLAD